MFQQKRQARKHLTVFVLILYYFHDVHLVMTETFTSNPIYVKAEGQMSLLLMR